MTSMGGGQAGSMLPWQRRILRDNRNDLVQDLDVAYIINKMIQEDVLKRPMQETIMSKATSIEKTEAFLDILPTRGEKAFWTFLDALEETYDHLHLKIKEAMAQEESREMVQSEIYEELDDQGYMEPRNLEQPSQFQHPQSYVTSVVSHQGDSCARNREVKPTIEITEDVTGSVVDEYNKNGIYATSSTSPDTSVLYSRTTESYLGATASPCASSIVDLRRPRYANFVATGEKITIKKGSPAIAHTILEKEGFAVIMHRLRLVCIPLQSMQDHGDPKKEKWYSTIPLAPQQAEQMLKDENQEGLFMAYQPTYDSANTPYEISLRLASGTVKHYPIYKFEQGQLGFMNERIHFKNLKHLVEYHRLDRGILDCRLRRGLGELDDVVSFGKEWEIDPADVDFDVGNKLGSGCSGTVHQALYKNKVVAVKQSKSDPRSKESIIEEAQVMIALKHDNILRLLGVICRDEPSLVTECLHDGDLGSWLKRNVSLDNSMRLHICQQATAAVLYLHQQRWVLLRMIAAHNCVVMVTPGGAVLIKIADLSMARRVMDDCYHAERDEKIAKRWCAPEVLQDMKYTSKSDIWSLAVLMWEVHTGGEKPFSGLNKAEVVRMVRDVKHSVMSTDPPKRCAPEMCEIMEKCFEYSPADRPCAFDINEELVACKEALAGSENHLQPVDHFALQRLAMSCQDLSAGGGVPGLVRSNPGRGGFLNRFRKASKESKNKTSYSPSK